jgi:hypothetical protein
MFFYIIKKITFKVEDFFWQIKGTRFEKLLKIDESELKRSLSIRILTLLVMRQFITLGKLSTMLQLLIISHDCIKLIIN